MKKVSDATLDALRGISADELVSRGVISEAPNHKGKRGYCCPLCGSGTGQNHNGRGDGAGEFDDQNRFFCHACKNADNGGHKLSTIDLFAISRNLQNDSFIEKCKQMCQEFGLPADFEEMSLPSRPRRFFSENLRPKPEKPPIDPAEFDCIRADLLMTPDENLKTFVEQKCGGAWRGLPLDILLKHGCKYVEKWTRPKSRAEKKYSMPTPRVIVPAGSDNYLARFVGNVWLYTEKEQQYIREKEHAGHKKLFISRRDVLNSDEPIFAVEGYIDAMSIELAGFDAVALGGRGDFRLLVDAVADKDKKPQIVILMDADEAGREFAPKLFDELIGVGCPCVVRFLTADVSKLDCNRILTEQGLDALRGILQSLVDDSLAELDATANELENRKNFYAQLDAELKDWRARNQKLHRDLPLADSLVEEFRDAADFASGLTADAFKSDFAYDGKILRKIAVLNLFSSTRAKKFFDVIRDARDRAAKSIKDADEPSDETKSLARIVPSDIERRVEELVSSLKYEIKKHAADIAQQNKFQADMERWQQRQAAPKRTEYQLSDEQAKWLFNQLDTNLYDALRLNHIFGAEIRYLIDTDRWLTFDKKNGVWTRGSSNTNAAILPFAGKMAKILEQNEPPPSQCADAENIVKHWQDNARIGAAINLLKAVERIRITTDDLDRHAHLLNTLSGVVDLQTGALYETVDPALLIAQKTCAAYRKGCRNEHVEKFLADILPDDDRAALIRFLGYSLTASVREEVALLGCGRGGNGKGTLTKFLMTIYGDYAASVPVTAVIEAGRLKDAGAATTELNVLEKCRLGVVEELPQDGRLDVAKFKALTGGDKIPIRRLYSEFVHIEPTHKLLLSGNHLPVLSDTRDPGILRRLLNLNFAADFTKNPDRHLKEKLLVEDARDAMLTLLVEAAQDWYRDGLIVTSRMKDATRQYLADNDFIAAFVDEYCARDNGGAIDRKSFLNKLKTEYPRECARLSDRALTDAAAKIEGISYRRGGSDHIYKFFGIRWRRDSDDDTQSADDLRGQPVDDDDLPFDS